MPIGSSKVCKKCGGTFKVWNKIDGKWRNFRNRVYCLECSPFKQHNTRQLHVEKSKDKARSTSRSSTYNRERRKKFKLRALSCLGGKCVICGYDRCPEALDFHHVDPLLKEFNVSGTHAAYYAWDIVKAELDKCVILCATCHREVEAGFVNLDV